MPDTDWRWWSDVRWLATERSDDLTALAQRVQESFLGRCVLRFARMKGVDRASVVSAQAFTALIPLFIIVASAAPSGQEDVVGKAIIRRFALTGESADAVAQLFSTPPGATSSVTIFSALLMVYSGVSFTRRLQGTYRAAWDQDRVGIRSTVFATLGLLALIAEIALAAGVRAFVSHLPFDWLWAVLISLTAGLFLWTSIPYLLLDRQVHWRRLLGAGCAASIGMTVFAIGTPIYMPDLMTQYTAEFGLFGVTVTMIGWLLAAAGVLVASAAVGAEFDLSQATWVVRLRTRIGFVDPDRPLPPTLSDADGHGLTVADVRALVRLLINWSIMAAAVWVATAAVPGIDVEGGLVMYLVLPLLLGLVNAVLGPVLLFLAGTQSWLSLGGTALLVNGTLLAATAGLSDNLEVAGFGSAVLGAFAISVAAASLELLFRPARAAALLRSPGKAPPAG